MRTKKHIKDSQSLLSLDALMDILTCVIGILLLLIVFGILQSKTVKITKKLPRMNISEGSNPDYQPEQKQKILPIYCQANECCIAMNWNDMFEEFGLIGDNAPEMTYKNFPAIIRNANKRKVNDYFFDYELYLYEYKKWDYYQYTNYREPYLIRKKKDNFYNGEDTNLIANLKKILNEYDTSKYWLNFFVDTSSVLLFREIRKNVDEIGYSMGWPP